MKLIDIFRKFRRGKDGCPEWEALLTPGLISSVEDGFFVDCLDTGYGQAQSVRALRQKYQILNKSDLMKAAESSLYDFSGKDWEQVGLFETVSRAIAESGGAISGLDGVWGYKAEIALSQQKRYEAPSVFEARLNSVLAQMGKLFETGFFESIDDVGGLSARAFSLDLSSKLFRLGHSAGYISQKELEEGLNEIFYLTVSHYQSWRGFIQGYLAALACCWIPTAPVLGKAIPACLYDGDSPWVACEVF